MHTRDSFRQFNSSHSDRSGARRGVWPRAAALLLTSALLLGPLPALAQEEPPPDPELEQIKKEQARVELEKAKLDLAEKARGARFPKPTSAPLAGTTETNDAAFIEELIQGHNSVNAAAGVVADRICSGLSGVSTIVVHNQSSVGMMTTYAAGLKRIEALKSRYDEVNREQQAAIDEDVKRDKQDDHQMPKRAAAEAKDSSGGRSLPVALGAATSVVGSFVDLLSFFRTNVDIKGTTFDVGNAVFVSSLFDAFRQNRQGKCKTAVSLYHPAAVPPNLTSLPDSVLLREVETLFAKREDAEELKKRIDERVARRQKQINDLKKLIEDAKKAIKKYEDELAGKGGGGGAAGGQREGDDPFATIAPGAGGGRGNTPRRAQKKPQAQRPPQKPEQKPDPRGGLEADIAKYEALIAVLEKDVVDLNKGARRLPGVNTQFDNLLKDLLAVDEASGISLLSGYLLTEGLQEVMKQDGSYWLVLDVVKAGGNRKVKTNLIWDVFRGGAKVTHSGGAVVHFNVYNRAGASVLSGVHGQYLKYRSADKIQ